MSERRPTKSELRLKRVIADEPEQEQGRRGILELFPGKQPDEDAPLHRAGDDDAAA
ncbi:MAG: hypothetical protein QOG85_1619 [Gaiellaceae bacterium]|jgi:hypothetical protein|nr:hypothetical protein [Gaiellaceae bacterium]